MVVQNADNCFVLLPHLATDTGLGLWIVTDTSDKNCIIMANI